MNDGAYGAKAQPGGSFKSILKSVAIAFIVTFIILIIAALLLCFLDFPEKYTLPVVIAATILGVLSGSYRSARRNEDKPLISALLTAVVYVIIAYIISCIIVGKIAISSNTALFAAIALVTGAAAAILAGRAGKQKGKYKGTPNILSDRFKKSGTFKFGKGGN